MQLGTANDFAAIEFFFTQQNLKQGAFARSVAADEANFHIVRQRRFGALFEVRTVREQYQRAPVAFAFWFVITLAFAIPLYLLKIEMIPREAAWLPSLVFVAFIFPARLMTGWAVARADKALNPRFFLFRWTGRPIMFAVAAFYVLIVFFTQFTSWNGIWSLYFEQHVFQLPVPFVNLAE